MLAAADLVVTADTAAAEAMAADTAVADLVVIADTAAAAAVAVVIAAVLAAIAVARAMTAIAVLEVATSVANRTRVLVVVARAATAPHPETKGGGVLMFCVC